MINPLPENDIARLTRLLHQKQSAFDQAITNGACFADVKAQYAEIRKLKWQLQARQQSKEADPNDQMKCR